MGSRRAIALIALFWGALNLLTAFVPVRGTGSVAASLLVLVVLRSLMGVAQAPFFPATGGALTCNWFPVTGWAFPSSLGNVGLTLGAAATGPLIAWLMLRFGWRASFALTAPIAFVLAAVWWWYVRDTPAQHRGVSPAERALIDRDRPASLCEPPSPGSARRMLRDPQVLLLTASYFCSNYVFYFFFNWLFIYLVENRGMKVPRAASPPRSWITGAVGALWAAVSATGSPGVVGKRSRPPLALERRGLRPAPRRRRRGLRPVPRRHAPLASASGSSRPRTPYWSAAISVFGTHSSGLRRDEHRRQRGRGRGRAARARSTVRVLGWPAALAPARSSRWRGAALWWIRADREFEPAA